MEYEDNSEDLPDEDIIELVISRYLEESGARLNDKQRRGLKNFISSALNTLKKDYTELYEQIKVRESDAFKIFMDISIEFISDDFETIVEYFTSGPIRKKHVLEPSGTSKLDVETQKRQLVNDFIEEIRRKLM